MAPIGLVAVLVAVLAACGNNDDDSDGEGLGRDQLIEKGDALFHGPATCAICHGPDLDGTSMGPSFLSDIYAPGHHPDAAFFAAVENGVQPHHWDFGPMPPLPDVSRDDVEAIVAYIRSVQQAQGIE